jgi:hypothetical protein
MGLEYMITLIPSPFEEEPAARGYNITPAVAPTEIRRYADRDTQAAFDMWKAGAAHVACMVTESTLGTDALRERINSFAEQQ